MAVRSPLRRPELTPASQPNGKHAYHEGEDRHSSCGRLPSVHFPYQHLHAVTGSASAAFVPNTEFMRNLDRYFSMREGGSIRSVHLTSGLRSSDGELVDDLGASPNNMWGTCLVVRVSGNWYGHQVLGVFMFYRYARFINGVVGGTRSG